MDREPPTNPTSKWSAAPNSSSTASAGARWRLTATIGRRSTSASVTAGGVRPSAATEVAGRGDHDATATSEWVDVCHRLGQQDRM